MTQKQTIWLIGILIGTIVLTNLPFLQGPNFLNILAQLFYNGGQMVGMIGLLIIPYGFYRTYKEFENIESKKRLFAILLWALPLTIFLSTTYISNYTRDFSRTFAIKRAENLIGEIDNFRKAKGFYPDSLAQLNVRIPNSGIIGINNYYYEKKFDNFNLTFYQNVILSFNYEIVTYDETDNHMAKGELKELYDTGIQHWKYEIFD